MPSRWLFSLLVIPFLATAVVRGDPPFPLAPVKIEPPTHQGSAPITALRVSSDGKHLIAAGGTFSRKAWPLGKEDGGLAGGDSLAIGNNVALSRDGLYQASGGDDCVIHVMERRSGLERLPLVGHEGLITAVAFGPGGKTVISASLDKTVRVWDAATGKELRRLKGHRDQVNSIRLSPDEKVLATASMDHSVRLWDAEGKELRRLDGHDMGVVAVDFTPDGKRLASGSLDGNVRIWDAATGQEKVKFLACDRGVWAVAFLPDGKAVAVGDGEGSVRLWNAETGKAEKDLTPEKAPPFRDAIGALAWSPDGQTLATASEEGIRLWDAATGRQTRLLGRQLDTIWSLAWSPDGKQVASAGRRDGTVHVWDTETGEELFLFGHAHQGGVSRLAYSRDGKRLASGGGSFDPSICIWDTQKGKLLQKLRAPMQFLEGVAWAPDGKRLASVSQDGVVRVWDAEEGKELRKLQGPVQSFQALEWSPDGRWLATAGGQGNTQGVTCLWDPEGLREPRLLGVGSYGGGRSLSFSPDGRTLATGARQNASPIASWEVATGQERFTFPAEQGEGQVVAFAPDGKRVAVGGSRGTALIVNLGASPPKQRLDAASLQKCWDDLAGNPGLAFQALCRLTTDADRAVPFLRARIKPARPSDLTRLPQLINDLDDESFAVRERASRDLERFGDLIEEPLRKARKDATSLEVRLRLDSLLAKIDGPLVSGERLRQTRAVEALESAATAEARELLEELATGAPEAWLTREARLTLERLKRQ